MFFVLLFLLVAEVWWQITLAYPPTLEQLNLGVANPFMLWGVRIISLGLLLGTIFLLSFILPTYRRYYWMLLLASPTLSLIWMSYPLDALKLFFISLTLFLLKTKPLWLVIGVTTGVLLFLNLGVFNQNPSIVKALSLNESQKEVTHRFTMEDNLTPHIEVPTWVRRLGYNKFFITLKNVGNESLPFFNLETFFFQEVHPQNQKATVMFFWPQIFILAFSVWFLLKKRLPNMLIVLFFLSFIYFITTNTSIERRLILTMWPLSLIMASFLGNISNYSKSIKIVIGLLLFLTAYGWATNLYDRSVRPLYWLDNRPPAYHFFLTSLKGTEKLIIIPDTLHATARYCSYYFKNCNLKTENFDLSRQTPQLEAIYVGFVGNFLGPNSNNNFPDYEKRILESKLEILAKTHIRDNIAHGYGHELLIVKVK